MSFPSDQELNSKIQKSSNWLKWKDVPLDEWFYIVKTESVDTRYGDSMIMTLQDRKQNTFITYTTTIIKNELESRPECNYIKSTGMVKNKKYFGFELVCHK